MALDQETLRPLRELLEKVRERVDYAIERLRSLEEPRSLRWRCTNCGHTRTFTRPMPVEVAPPCPKCNGVQFEAV